MSAPMLKRRLIALVAVGLACCVAPAGTASAAGGPLTLAVFWRLSVRQVGVRAREPNR